MDTTYSVRSQRGTGIHQITLLHHITGRKIQTAGTDQLGQLLQKGRMALFIMIQHKNAAFQQRPIEIL